MSDASMDRLSALARHPSVEAALAAVRELLGVEVAWATHHTDGDMIIEAVDGDAGSFGVAPGGRLPLEEAYCSLILDGRLPNLIGDVRADPVAGPMQITEDANIGAFASVPLQLSDGRVHGTLCCSSHEARELSERDLQFLHIIGRIVADHVERDELQRRRETERLQEAGVEALLAAVEARDGYTGEHSRAVVDHAVAVARHLGLDPRAVRQVEHVALLHDVGKLGMPDAILRKPGRLDDTEWDVMRQHPVVGARIVACLPGLEHLAPAVRAEHERWDGTGYPDRLAGEAIPLASRIALVCDAYHAMTSDRPYRRALGHEVAVDELRRHAGTQFCPRSVDALLAVLGADAALPLAA